MLTSHWFRWRGTATFAGAVVAVGLAMVARPARASGPVGLEVLVQAWSPTDPLRTEHPSSVYKSASLFSDTIGHAWEDARGPVCDALKQQLGKPDLVAKGFTLYDIACTMGHIESMTLGQKAYGSSDIQLNLVITGNSLEATSTQPSVCGKECDARASVAYTVTLATSLRLYPFKIDAGAVTVSDVRLDPHSAVAGVAATLDSFFMKGHYKTLAENALSVTKALPVDVINTKLAAVQNPLQPYVDTYASIGSWVRDGLLIVDLATKPVPNPAGGSISGIITWAKSAPVTALDCSAFGLVGKWQDGPAPLQSPPDTLGAEPSVAAGQLSMQPVIDRGDHYECGYTLAQLPFHYPTSVQSTVAAGKGADTKSEYSFTLVGLEPTAWGGNVTPNVAGRGFDFKVVTHTVQSKPLGNQVMQTPKTQGDPLKSSVAQTAAQTQVAPAPQTQAAPAAQRQVAPAARAGTLAR